MTSYGPYPYPTRPRIGRLFRPLPGTGTQYISVGPGDIATAENERFMMYPTDLDTTIRDVLFLEAPRWDG